MLRNLLLMLTVMVVCLAVTEFGLHVADRYHPRAQPPPTRLPELYAPSPDYGYSLWPSTTNTYTYPPAEPRLLTVRSNAHGFREARELDQSDDRPRVLVVGDSFVFGEGVEADERFTNQLEAVEPAWRIDNIGMTGWGPDLMLLAVEAVAPVVSPDVVVFTLFTDDFRRVRTTYAGMGFAIPRFVLEDGRLTQVAYPTLRFWERSHLYQGVRILLTGSDPHPFAGATEKEWAVNEAILHRFLEVAEQRDFAPMILYLPGPWQGGAHDRRREWVRDFSSRREVALLDLTEAIQQADSSAVFLTENSHYTAVGHGIVAAQLREFLARSGLLP